MQLSHPTLKITFMKTPFYLAISTSCMHGCGTDSGATKAMQPIMRLPEGKGQNCEPRKWRPSSGMTSTLTSSAASRWSRF
jgi:hypothetical protein